MNPFKSALRRAEAVANSLQPVEVISWSLRRLHDGSAGLAHARCVFFSSFAAARQVIESESWSKRLAKHFSRATFWKVYVQIHNPPATDMEEEFIKSASFWPRFWRISISSKLPFRWRMVKVSASTSGNRPTGEKSALEKDLPVGHWTWIETLPCVDLWCACCTIGIYWENAISTPSLSL